MKQINRTLRRIGIVGMCLLCRIAQAHDTWLYAEPMRASPGEEVRLVLASGEEFPKSEHGTDPARVAEWVMIHEAGTKPVSGYAVQNEALVATAKVENQGLHVCAIALKPKFIELEPKQFEEYLEHVAATAAIELRRQTGKTSEPGREYYTKFAKTFIDAGYSEKSGVHSTPLGHALEIIPLYNPRRVVAGETVRAALLLRGKRAAGVSLTVSHNAAGPRMPQQRVTTDAEGVAEFEVSSDGLYAVNAHVIEPMPEAEQPAGGPRADWRSYWASITFQVKRDIPGTP